jgi:HEAT repeat protein
MTDQEHPVVAAHAARDREDVEALLSLLSGTHPMARISAAHGLGDLRATEAIEPLIRCLQARDELLRISALKALAKIGDERAADAVYESATEDPAFGARAAAAETLARLDDPRAVDVLGAMFLEDQGRYSRSFPKWATKLLVEISGTEAIPQLEAAARDAHTLNRFRLRRTVKTLRAMIEE